MSTIGSKRPLFSKILVKSSIIVYTIVELRCYIAYGGIIMIYTVTFNPALDYIMHTGKINIGETNRSKSEEIYIGGKGINVSLILRELDTESSALGFVAGFTGNEIESRLAQKGIRTDFVKLENGNTRINVKIKGESETEINGKGPDIDGEALSEFFVKLKKLNDGDTLILAGSIPGSLPETSYSDILQAVSDKNINTVVDASGKLLVNVLKYRPFLVKPNTFELSEIFGKMPQNEDEIIEDARKLRNMGARNVIVSMAGDGAILLDETGKVHRRGAGVGKVVNSVGAGDSMVAGFVAGYQETSDYEYALKLGTACGAATAFSSDLASRDKINEVFDTLL